MAAGREMPPMATPAGELHGRSGPVVKQGSELLDVEELGNVE